MRDAVVVQDEVAMRSEDGCCACLGPCEALSGTLFAGGRMYGKTEPVLVHLHLTLQAANF